MAGGIDWFRWHHGTVNDQKFPLVARRAGVSVAEVIAVWACVLERASMNEEERGTMGDQLDFEAMDCALGLDDGKSFAILKQFQTRQMVDDQLRVTAWNRRQPKREDATAADRQRAKRERDAASKAVTESDVTQIELPVTHENDSVTQSHDREEKSREEKRSTPQPPKGEGRFAEFWDAWPKSPRKNDRKRCLAKWQKHRWDSIADRVIEHVKAMSKTRQWLDGYEPAPLTYLNGERWDDGLPSEAAESKGYDFEGAI